MTNACPACGHLLSPGSRFCPVCGAKLAPEADPPNTGATTALGPRCQQPIGLLVPHRCGRSAQSSCHVCGQPFCDEHLTIDAQGPICAACAGGSSADSAGYYGTGYYSSSDLDYFDRVSEDDRGEDFADLS